MTESRLIHEIQIAASRHGARLFRNNIGRWRDPRGRWIRYGVANPGGADLIGWSADGRFVAIEVKLGTARTTQSQLRFIAAVIMAGGIAGVARSVQDAEEILHYLQARWKNIACTAQVGGESMGDRRW